MAGPRLPGDLDELVLGVVNRVPRGCVVSYGHLAVLLQEHGWTCTPRRVARAMSEHAGQPGLPWWRVIRSDGRAAAPVADEAERRLGWEGVRLPVPGRAGRPWWEPSAEDLMWLRAFAAPGRNGSLGEETLAR